MTGRIHQILQQIEEGYSGGATRDALSKQIVDAASRIAKLRKNDPVRKGAEVFAPLLWGAASGSSIRSTLVKTALAGSDGDAYLESWSNVGRGLLAFRIAG